jgi:hypothetical protein
MRRADEPHMVLYELEDLLPESLAIFRENGFDDIQFGGS